MYLKKLIIKNFRLLLDIELDVDETATLIVGKNNSGKTSFMDFLLKVLGNKKLTFADYPIIHRKELYENIKNYLEQKMEYEEMRENIHNPLIEFFIDYSSEKEDENLGGLSEFIIDIDPNITEAIIRAEYKFNVSEEKFLEWFNSEEIEEIKEKVELYFEEMFKLTIEAVNPTDKKDKLLKGQSELNKLFLIYQIKAERAMDESDLNNKTPLSPLLKSLFNNEFEKKAKEVQEEVENLKKTLRKKGKDSEIEINKILNNIIEKTVEFGYPNIEELKLKIKTKMDLEEQIKNNTDLIYIDNEMGEVLPSTYNGLGYKNLIKIEFELEYFSRMIINQNFNCIPILFLEEPESHMHPQLQQRFIEYLSNYLKKISEKEIQVIITTHSSHISSSENFKRIRFIHRRKNYIEYKNLSKFCNENKENVEFIQKYLTLTKCDLFFADKIILVEGASERILIPDMIKKCNKNGEFENKKYNLNSQYYTILEVGGAHAHKFIPFIDFLNIPTLIITDIDSIGKNNKACCVSKGIYTSNATIKYWIKKIHGEIKKDKIKISDIKKISDNEKTLKNCHIEYQIEENGVCGRSLEEAILNINEDLIKNKKTNKEEKIKFTGSKTDFALNLLNKEEYKIPIYILNGLKWLDKQKLYSEDKNE